MASKELCSIGLYTKSDCYKKKHTDSRILDIKELTNNDRDLIILCSGINPIEFINHSVPFISKKNENNRPLLKFT